MYSIDKNNLSQNEVIKKNNKVIFNLNFIQLIMIIYGEWKYRIIMSIVLWRSDLFLDINRNVVNFINKIKLINIFSCNKK